jgi:hypothetical protein
MQTNVRVAVVIALAAVIVAPVNAQETGAPSGGTPPVPEVKTAATAERGVSPDLARVTFSFSAEGPTRQESGERMAAHLDSVRRALETLGIPHDSLVTASNWYWWSGRIGSHVGCARHVLGPYDQPGRPTVCAMDTIFTSSDAIEARIHDLRKVGPAIDVALAHGVTNISSIRFSAQNVSAAREDALREATQRARRQAQAIAEAAGAQLGPVLGFSTERENAGFWYAGEAFENVVVTEADSRGAAGAPTDIVQPSVPVRVTVYGRWTLIPKP